MKKLFKYLESIWTGDDGKPSGRRALAIAFAIDLIINFHHASTLTSKLVKLIAQDKILDANVLNSMASILAHIAMIIGIEAGLVAAFFTLTTYQNIQLNKPTDTAISNVENVEQVTVEQVQASETAKK